MVPSGQGIPTGFSDYSNCASFLLTASPETNGTVLTQGCYHVGSITAGVKCFSAFAQEGFEGWANGVMYSASVSGHTRVKRIEENV